MSDHAVTQLRRINTSATGVARKETINDHGREGRLDWVFEEFNLAMGRANSIRIEREDGSSVEYRASGWQTSAPIALVGDNRTIKGRLTTELFLDHDGEINITSYIEEG